MSEDAVENTDAGPPAPPQPPSWLNSELIETALRSEHPDICISHLNVEAAVAAGENYACIVYRALAKTNHGDYPLILKCMPESDFRATWVRESGIITCEAHMYNRTLPMLRGELKRPNFPPFYHAMQDGSRDTLILRDLRPLGYRTHLRQLGLDVTHCRLALRELAHLHGLSAALRVQEPELFKTEIREFYVEKLYSEANREKFGPFFSSTLNALADAVKFKLPYRFHSIADLMCEMSDLVYDEMVDILKMGNDEELSKNKIVVLNHGDFWCNNILFQYDDENTDEPLACSLIDFQIARTGAPVLDLLYFLYTSTDQKLRRDHMDELLQLYLDEAHAAMKEKGVEQPSTAFYQTVREIHDDLRENSVFGFLSSCFVLPLVIAEAKDVPDLDSFTEEDFKKMEKNPFLKMYSGPLFCRRFTELLEDFDDMGFFKKIQKKIASSIVEENVSL